MPKKRLVKVTSYVWCDRHGLVHEDTMNPYDYEHEHLCQQEEHRPVYIYAAPDEEEF